MVDKLRKFGELLWLNKERLILVAMVVILCYQVYTVVYPNEKPHTKPPLPPKAGPTGPPLAARSFTYSVANPGTYQYVCVLHLPSGMAGKLTVSP